MDGINRRDFKYKHFKIPPEQVYKVFMAVHILFKGKEGEGWKGCKKMLGSFDFLKRIFDYDTVIPIKIIIIVLIPNLRSLTSN